MGLLNYIKGTIKENYDLEDIEDIEDIDDFVYDDERNTGEEQKRIIRDRRFNGTCQRI